MRSIAICALCIFASLTPNCLMGQQDKPIQKNPPKAPVENPKAVGYGIGFDIGKNIAAGGITADDMIRAELIRGLSDGLDGKESAYAEEVIQLAMKALSQKILQRKLDLNQKFLDDNKKKEGVQVTESGLQYKVLKTGTGPTPTKTSQVTVHYEGKLTSGKIFDSSIKRNEPTSFGVTQVISGWTEALLKMKVGDKWQLVIPSKLAYGPNGRPPVIGPNEILIFEVELLDVK